MAIMLQALFLLLTSEFTHFPLRVFGSDFKGEDLDDLQSIEKDLLKVMRDNQSFWPGEMSLAI